MPNSRSRTRPGTTHERALASSGFDLVAGLDEVGRGAWAGPVSVGVVVLPTGRRAPAGIRDSKELSEDQREAVFPRILAWCADWSVGHADPGECDRLGMTAALRLAAGRALAGLTRVPDAVLLDGNHDYINVPASDDDPTRTVDGRLPVRTVVGGDRISLSIAAASIIAKVTRDRMMRVYAPSFPAFDFDRNKGYPSPVHRRALAGHGLTSLHRRSWSYVEELPFR